MKRKTRLIAFYSLRTKRKKTPQGGWGDVSSDVCLSSLTSCRYSYLGCNKSELFPYPLPAANMEISEIYLD